MPSVLGLPVLPEIFYAPGQAESPTLARDALELPPIGVPVDAKSPRIADSTNPGTSNPTQNTQVRLLSVDQTMSALATSAPLHTSDGQVQRLDLSAGQRGITVTTGLPTLINSDGNAQTPWIIPAGPEANQRPGGLPAESRPDSQNPTKHTVSATIGGPIAKDVKADNQRPGRLPKSHIIR